MDGLLPTRPFLCQSPTSNIRPGGVYWHILPGLCLWYLARGRRHLASRHLSLGHQSFRFVLMGLAVRSCGQGKVRSVGLLTPGGLSHQSLSWPASEGSLEERHMVKPNQLQVRQKWPSSPCPVPCPYGLEEAEGQTHQQALLQCGYVHACYSVWEGREVPRLLLRSSILEPPSDW